MKNLLMINLFLTIGIGIFVSQGFAEVNNKALMNGYKKALLEGQAMINTPSEEAVLAEAIKQAIVINNAPACQTMKIAVDLKYNPYFVIKNIFSHGSAVDLDQLCICATEYGINKQIFAKASMDAVSPFGEPLFSEDELAECQCMQEIGLGYHGRKKRPHKVKPPRKRRRFSRSRPT